MTNSTLIGEIGRTRNETIQLLEEVRRLLADHGKDVPLASTTNRLCLALVGQYNAGKSTLVNALVGEKRAKTGDAPETKVAQNYTLQDFDIIDLPGREARLAEQEEAARALPRAHAILYVVSSSSGLDYETFWRDLEDIGARPLPFLLVVNDKQAHSSNEAERAYSEKILAQYREKASARLGPSAPTPYWVNAKRAEQGRLQGKTVLTDASGIIVLESDLAKFLFESEPFLRDLVHLSPFREALAMLQEEIKGHIANPARRQIAEALQKCDSLREQLLGRANSMAEERFVPLRDAIAGVAQREVISSSTKKGVKKAASGTEIEKICDSVFQSALIAFEKECNGELVSLQRWMESKVPKIEAKKGGVNIKVGEIPKLEAEEIDIAAAGRRLTIAATSLISAAGKGTSKQVAKGGVEALATQSAESATTQLAKEGGKTAGKTVSKVIGPVVVIIISVWEIWSAYKKAAREKQLIAAALREAEAKAALAAVIVKDEFRARAHVIVHEALGQVIRDLQSTLSIDQADLNVKEAQAARVSDIRNRLDDAIGRLQARSRL